MAPTDAEHQPNEDSKSKKFCQTRFVCAALVACVCILTAICAFLGFFLFTQSSCIKSLDVESVHGRKEPLSKNGCDEFCLSEPCVAAASSILKIMDKTVDPCENFYQYACGKWKRNYPLPEDKVVYDTFSRLREDVQMALKGVLETESDDCQSNMDCNVTNSIKNLYKSCVNTTTIETRGEKPLIDLIESLGDWPILNINWNESWTNLTQLLANLKMYNNDVLFAMWVGADSKNSSINILSIDQPDLIFPSREYYLKGDDKVIKAYHNYVRGVARLLGADSVLVDLEAQAIVEFEMKLANLTKPAEQRRDIEALYNKVTIQQLSNYTKQIEWLKYFEMINSNLTESEPVVVFSTQYLHNLDHLLNYTSKRTVINYAMWRFIQNRVINLDNRFLQLRQNFLQIVYGRQRQPDRWRDCIAYVNSNVGMVVGAMFVKDNFNNRSKELAEEMINSIRQAFLDLLDHVDWMDEQTKQVARNKAVLMSEKVGYPEYILNPGWMSSHYSELMFEEDTYFENVLKNLKHLASMDQEKLRLPHFKNLWSTTPAVVNAFYNRAKNQITFPAGILQPPFFSKDYPRSLNYGGIGVVIGHELTHGFDDRGRQFDQDGNLIQWWNDEAINRFRKKVECVIHQYSNYTMPEINMKLNGFTTQGENIADNGGIKQAFRAYKKWVQVNGEEPLLPGLSLTHDQLFFVSFAQVWCGIMRPEAAISKIRSGPHSPGMFRVIGTVSNSQDFSNAFNCPLGSQMNPMEKCAVW